MLGHPSKMQDREELYRLYWTEGKSTSEIGKIYNVSFKRVSKWLKRLDIPTRPWSTKGFKFEGRKLSQEHKDQLSKWHTGRPLSPEHKKKVVDAIVAYNKKHADSIGKIKKAHGKYLSIKVADGKWKYYHRYIVEQKLGRELKREEEVHHINCDSGDNNINNLVVLSRSEHLLLHNQMERVIEKLFKLGIAYFDGKDYQVVDLRVS